MVQCCGGGTRLIYTCAGGSDVGEITDRVARKLDKDGYGKMYCLAGLGAQLSAFIASAKGADENIVIDGCPVSCGKKIFEHAGIPCRYYVLTKMGLTKGQTPVTSEIVDKIVRDIRQSSQPLPSSETKNSCCGG